MSVIDDTLLGLDAGLHVERRATIEAFVQYDADAPPITAAIVVGALYHFRCHVLTCADNAAGHLSAIVAVAPIQQAFAVRMLFSLSPSDESTAETLATFHRVQCNAIQEGTAHRLGGEGGLNSFSGGANSMSWATSSSSPMGLMPSLSSIVSRTLL